jgi:acetyl-CoA decarbonylase/synthase complex subunit delta
MTFSSLAGSVGGGQQTPGFMGCGKVFLTSRKLLFAEGGHRRLVWMPKELKNLLADDLRKRFAEQGVPDMLDKIADETVGHEASAVRAYMEKVGHPALQMEDMTNYAEAAPRHAPAQPAAEAPRTPAPAAETAPAQPEPAAPVPPAPAPAPAPAVLGAEAIAELKAQIAREVRAELTREVAREIIAALGQKFLGEPAVVSTPATAAAPTAPAAPAPSVPKAPRPRASARIGAIGAFPVPKDKAENSVWTVKLGATKAEGGTRGRTCTIGGAQAMPFHHWEGAMPNRPRVAMEVFDVPSEKLPPVLAQIYGPALRDPAALAKRCVGEWGAELISVRLDGTHPERGNRKPEQAVETVQAVLRAVDVPVIVTGHNHFDRNNEVLKAVAQACAGENLLLNWVEQNNYRTIAGAAIGYGHALVAQSPIDVNIGKQLNILLTNMDVKPGQIVMDPMTGALGYGLEYTYSVMERMRLTGLGGDKMLAGPMIVSPGQECAKVKELKASEKDFPAWGPLAQRAALWELGTALGLLYAGADLLIMYHPEAVAGLKKAITDLMVDGE